MLSTSARYLSRGGGRTPNFSERNVSPFLKPPVHIVDYYSLFIPVYCMVELAYCYVQTDY